MQKSFEFRVLTNDICLVSIMGSLKAIQVQQKPSYIKRKVYKHICEYHIRDLEVQPYSLQEWNCS